MNEDPKRKGRPPLQEGKRTFKIDVRFTEEEYKLILDMEKTLSISKTNLIRTKVLRNGAGTVLNAKALIRELSLLSTELGRSGNNINQLAHHANTLKLKSVLSPAVVKRFILLLENHLKTRAELNISLRRLIRILGS
ncbi:MobC family plasmid mobilization relaxosome protein [Mucilaginibacter corticis]|uniref:MobC family plasmid mobilization relaxosome protein n=1 Tax=Mucilaginibacter corticis TaxID=2597670 RepID=A0A556MM79_9SPHI|nr:plasmid mobilization relaxosome protein MobC [Mucilaginibacter corticis]TSJ40958.1 MobC family plasmid mobilization relaxosome protein [Mucilaginibacter corticis]